MKKTGELMWVWYLAIEFHMIEIVKVEDAAIALGAVAQDSRLAIYRLLVKRGPDGYSPTDLVEKIDISAPTLSFHLKELQRAGLIASRREGRFLYYSAKFERMRGLIGFLTELVLVFGHDPTVAATPIAEGPVLLALGVLAGFAIGIIASLLGVAGGEFLIPTLVLLFGVEIKLAGSLSLAISLPTSGCVARSASMWKRHSRWSDRGLASGYVLAACDRIADAD